MKSLFLLLALVFSVSAILPRQNKNLVVEEHNRLLEKLQNEAKLFNDWRSKYNKDYPSHDEEQLRFSNFKNTLDRIQHRNSKTKNPVFGLNKFSDMSPKEFKKLLLGYVPRNHIQDHPIEVPSGQVKVPDAFDWRDQNRVTPVKNQGQCGSCCAFSVVENVESVYMIANSISVDQMLPLSVQQVVDCDDKDSGCNGGDPPTVYEYIINAGGLETDSKYPYTASDGKCSFDPSKIKVTISNWKYATQSKDEHAMQKVLVNSGPLSICVDAESWQDYSSGILSAADCGTNLDHCVQVTGYDTGSGFWSVRNSWGTDWGENGYIRLQFGQNTCGLTQEATTSCISC